jgi:hypothetical protein
VRGEFAFPALFLRAVDHHELLTTQLDRAADDQLVVRNVDGAGLVTPFERCAIADVKNGWAGAASELAELLERNRSDRNVIGSDGASPKLAAA